MFLQPNHFRNFLALLLIMVFATNVGYQYSSEGLRNQLKMDICDHTDSEKECEKNEKGETDDVIKPDPRVLNLSSMQTADKYLLTGLSQLSNHLETPTPPPEHLL